MLSNDIQNTTLPSREGKRKKLAAAMMASRMKRLMPTKVPQVATGQKAGEAAVVTGE